MLDLIKLFSHAICMPKLLNTLSIFSGQNLKFQKYTKYKNNTFQYKMRFCGRVGWISNSLGRHHIFCGIFRPSKLRKSYETPTKLAEFLKNF